MTPVINFVVVSLLWLVFSLLFHELGHYIIARLLGYQTKFGKNKKSFHVTVTGVDNTLHDSQITLGGLVLGYLPSLIVLLFMSPWLGLVYILGWTVSCWGEWKDYRKLYKELPEVNMDE